MSWWLLDAPAKRKTLDTLRPFRICDVLFSPADAVSPGSSFVAPGGSNAYAGASLRSTALLRAEA